jgi:hypothetical protein
MPHSICDSAVLVHKDPAYHVVPNIVRFHYGLSSILSSRPFAAKRKLRLPDHEMPGASALITGVSS